MVHFLRSLSFTVPGQEVLWESHLGKRTKRLLHCLRTGLLFVTMLLFRSWKLSDYFLCCVWELSKRSVFMFKSLFIFQDGMDYTYKMPRFLLCVKSTLSAMATKAQH